MGGEWDSSHFLTNYICLMSKKKECISLLLTIMTSFKEALYCICKLPGNCRLKFLLLLVTLGKEGSLMG
jgi:hypothetical protein